MSTRESITRFHLIINKLRRRKVSFAEMSDYLDLESEIQAKDFRRTIRTFQRDIDDIRSIYNINIKYDRSLKVYSIENNHESDSNERLFEAFDTLNALNLSDRLSSEIHFENRKPKGTENLYGLLHAIKNKVLITFHYQKFWDEKPNERTAAPYAIKEFKNRWYLLVNEIKHDQIKTFALDRLTRLDITQERFSLPVAFDVNEHFNYCFGIIGPNEEAPTEVVLAFDWLQGKYIKTLKLHWTQEIIEESEDELIIKLKLYLTHDFFMELLSFGDNVRVITPVRLIDDIKNSCRNMLKLYDGGGDDG